MVSTVTRQGSNTPARYTPVKICRGVSTVRVSGSAKSSTPSLRIEAKMTDKAASGGKSKQPHQGTNPSGQSRVMRSSQSNTEAMTVITKKMGIAFDEKLRKGTLGFSPDGRPAGGFQKRAPFDHQRIVV